MGNQYIAFEMRYTGRMQWVMCGSLSIPSRVELGIPGQLAAKQQTYRKHNTNEKDDYSAARSWWDSLCSIDRDC